MWPLMTLLLALGSGVWLDVPFNRQPKDGCGSASIWMVMKFWTPSATPAAEEIHKTVFSSQAGGVYTAEMERYFRDRGFRTVTFSGGWKDLQEQIASGRPLIVCLQSNARGTPLHYVVVAGLNPELGLVMVNDPADRKLRAMHRTDFEKRWRVTNNWTLVATPEKLETKADNIISTTPAATETVEETEDLVRASNAFRSENYAEARRFAARAVRREPANVTANDLLATVYFLNGNLEAALKYWNRIERPVIRELTVDPPVKLDAVRLDRAFTFSRGSLLSLSDYRRTKRQLDLTGAFSNYSFDLTPTEADDFNFTFRSSSRADRQYLTWFSGLPFQTVRPQVSNIGGQAMNLESLVRWDSQKRRALVRFSGPLASSASTRYAVEADGRDEQWEVEPGDRFRLRKVKSSLRLHSLFGSRGAWSSGVVVRSAKQSSIGYTGSAGYDLLRLPHYRLSTTAAGRGEVHRAGDDRFGIFESSIATRWLPQSSGTDFATLVQIKSGISSAATPFDERFNLGLDRDGDLRLRAHPATQDGRKGAAVIGNRYLLLNAEVEKRLHDFTLIRLSAAPFVDAAKLGTWFVDAGVELRLSIASTVGFSVSFGKDLRTGRTAVFADSRIP